MEYYQVKNNAVKRPQFTLQKLLKREKKTNKTPYTELVSRVSNGFIKAALYP